MTSWSTIALPTLVGGVLVLAYLPKPSHPFIKIIAERHWRKQVEKGKVDPEMLVIARAAVSFPRKTRKVIVRALVNGTPLNELPPVEREALAMLRARLYLDGDGPHD